MSIEIESSEYVWRWCGGAAEGQASPTGRGAGRERCGGPDPGPGGVGEVEGARPGGLGGPGAVRVPRVTGSAR